MPSGSYPAPGWDRPCGGGWNRWSRRTSACARTAGGPRASAGRRVSGLPSSRVGAAHASRAVARKRATLRRSSESRRVNPCRDPSPARCPQSGRSRTGKPGPASPWLPRSVCLRPSLLLGLSGRPRISSQGLQHPLFLDALQAPLQKINLQGLLADLALQLRNPPFGPALLAVPRKHVAWPLANLTPPAVQHVGVHLQRPRHLAQGNPLLQPLDCRQLELLGEHPSRQPHDSILL